MSDNPDDRDLDRRADAAVVPVEEPPVVARLVVEIRSDGSRTIARGAIEDQTLGQRVAIEAEGTTPAALAFSLARALLKAPFFSAVASRGPAIFRALLPGRRPRREGR